MVIFFIRRFNDLDHIAPVIHKMALLTNNDLLILLINPDFKISKDYRLNYLRKKHNVQVDYIYNVKVNSIKKKLLGLLVCNKNIVFKNRYMNLMKWSLWFASKILKSIIGMKKYQNIINRNFDLNWAKTLLDYYKPDILVFDWIKRYQHNAGVIFDAAKEKEIPLISLPHGINYLTSTFHTSKEEKQGHPESFISFFSDFNYLVVSTEVEKKHRIERGLDKNKVKTLGSARFSKEWVKINNSIIPKYLEKNNDRDPRLKVVFMEHSNHYRANDDEIKESINKISKLEDINLVVKAHTRSNRFFNKYDNVNLANSSITSTELVMWADAVIVTMSSIALEPLLQNKVLLYPEYFHRNTTLWGDYGSCWKINSLSELVDALLFLKKNPTYKPYENDIVDKFLSEAIYNGNLNDDILQNYVNFFEQTKTHKLN